MSGLTFANALTLATFVLASGVVIGQLRGLAGAFSRHDRLDRDQFDRINDTLGAVREGVARLEGRTEKEAG